MKKAFTLAETLITLAIIGIVAALTIPTLIQKYRDQVTVNQLKKHYSMMSQNFKKMLVDEDAENLLDTKLVKTFESGLESGDFTDTIQVFNKYFNTQVVSTDDSIKAHPLNGDGEIDLFENASTPKTFVFPDGSLLYLQSFIFGAEDLFRQNSYLECLEEMNKAGIKNCPNQFAGMFYFVDLNGAKGPNTLGRDIFNFSVDQFGRVWSNSIDCASLNCLDFSASNWASNTNGCGKPDKSLKEADGVGYGCAARIIENGWKIDY